MSDTNNGGEHLAEGSLISHLLELRSRLVKAAIAVVVAFAPCAFFANKLFSLIAKPLVQQMPEGSKMISTSVVGSFLVPIKLALIVSIVLAMPVILFQLWAFISPGLYKKEKRFAVPLLVSSVILFYVGVSFAYFLVFPLAFKFLIATMPEGASYTPDISSFLSFATMICLVFGAAFEIPIATILLLWSGIARFETLTKNRGYVLIGIAAITALITPPDPVSMLLMLVPMYLLYEMGILAARFMLKEKIADQAAQDAERQAAN
jgi:sec-independent protein translocase protein TatC